MGLKEITELADVTSCGGSFQGFMALTVNALSPLVFSLDSGADRRRPPKDPKVPCGSYSTTRSARGHEGP